MEAKNLKNGNTIYIFDRAQGTVSKAKVVSVSIPHFDANIGNASALVVDVCVEAGGESRTYTMRDTAEVSYSGNLTVATSQECLVREVEGVKQQAEQTLDQVEHLKNIVVKCAEILTEFNPSAKERAEMEMWKKGIEGDVHEMKSMMSTLLQKIGGENA